MPGLFGTPTPPSSPLWPSSLSSCSPPPPPPLASPPPAFLRLTTASIRRRIYRYVELEPCDGFPNRFDLRGRLADALAPDPSSFYGLLLSCRAIYTEAVALLYSSNRFVLSYRHRYLDGLGPLRALTAPALRLLSDLKIVLNQASCHEPTSFRLGGKCCVYLQPRKGEHYSRRTYDTNECENWHGGVHQRPLLAAASDRDWTDDDEARAVETLLDEWHSVAACLRQVAPGCLALSLVCDIDPQHPRALSVAESVVAPIYLLPPSHLRAFEVRLAKAADYRLQEVARGAVMHACGISDCQASKPAARTTLTTLPRELRLRILEYTDLITPRRQVIWSRQDGGYMIAVPGHTLEDTPEGRYDAQFGKCWWGALPGRGTTRLPTSGCFCRRLHSAFSLRCRCWAPPGPALFLLSRALYEDAQYVFFSGNRFIVHDFLVGPPTAHPDKRLAASEFLRDVVPQRSLAHLRFLELSFPPYGVSHAAAQDWRATVNWLRDKLSTPALTLRWMVADGLVWARAPSVEEWEQIVECHSRLWQPLTRLGDDGLDRFYAHFLSPKHRFPLRGGPEYQGRWFKEKDALKERAERDVIGGRYDDLYATGKEEPALSDWHEVYYQKNRT